MVTETARLLFLMYAVGTSAFRCFSSRGCANTVGCMSGKSVRQSRDPAAFSMMIASRP